MQVCNVKKFEYVCLCNIDSKLLCIIDNSNNRYIHLITKHQGDLILLYFLSDIDQLKEVTMETNLY